MLNCRGLSAWDCLRRDYFKPCAATVQPLLWLVLTIHIERANDFEPVREVLVGAFARTDEADLVDRLRDEALRIASLVAVEGDRVVRHAMFSRVWIDDGGA